MSKIAFDLDGVLVPDYHHIPGLTMAEFYQQTLYAKPLFTPSGEFDIVTARTEEYRSVTEEWIAQLSNRPRQVIMLQNKNETPAEFKFRTAVEQGYVLYIESDLSIVKNMRELAFNNNVDIGIVHFSEFVAQSFQIR